MCFIYVKIKVCVMVAFCKAYICSRVLHVTRYYGAFLGGFLQEYFRYNVKPN